MALFNLPPRATKAGDISVAKKVQEKPKSSGVTSKGGGTLLAKIATINAMVRKIFGQYEDRYCVIRSEDDLANYVDQIISNGSVAIDTETNSLDPITCTIAGMSIYTPGQKAAYVPINHVNYITGIRSEDQLQVEFIKAQLQRIVDQTTRIIMFNGKFDTRVIKHQIGIELTCYWDGYIAARLLNENEDENGLKALHKKYCLDGEGDAFSYEALFDGVPFTHVPINTGYLYAARDAEITYELFKFQEPLLDPNAPECAEHELQGVASVFRDIEMPLIPVVAAMEDTGVAFDLQFAKKLSEEYHKKLDTKLSDNFDLMTGFGAQLDEYRKQQGSANKLGYPVNLDSPPQVAIMLYDILKIPPVDPKKPRGTGEEYLEKMDHPIAKAILEYRGIAILLKTFIDKMPTVVNPKTHRIHGSFNQMGADTGRFSSSDPNMQNIPAHNKDIRKMFIATPGYVMMSSDYSAQEPRITAHLSKDKKMIQAYRDGKDLYVEIASLAYNLPYDECKEFRADGSSNPDGKKRRGSAKAIVLGVCYGKGVPAIAEDLGITKQKAQEVYDKVMTAFPGLKKFMEDSEKMAIEKGYVTTVWGRKRRLPNIQLNPYEFIKIAGAVSSDFDPMFDVEIDTSSEVDPKLIRSYTQQLNAVRGYRDRAKIVEKAKAQGIQIKDNGGFIAEARRQTVNSRVQGSAADQSKKAMYLVHYDPQLREWGFRLLLVVHDELIGECPEQYAAQAAKRFAELMVEAARDLDVPSKCDVEITKCWYGEPLHFD